MNARGHWIPVFLMACTFLQIVVTASLVTAVTYTFLKRENESGLDHTVSVTKKLYKLLRLCLLKYSYCNHLLVVSSLSRISRGYSESSLQRYQGFTERLHRPHVSRGIGQQ
jgi:hypothetical protein